MSEQSFLKRRLESTFCVDGVVNWETFKESLHHPNFPNRESEFKRELADAILSRSLSLKEFEQLTDIDFENQEEVAEFLKTEIWQPLYGDEPITLQQTA